ncbi:MAG: GNAT family N-acetyltransferase [Alphaproteobacteria bacterium]
MKPTLRDGGLTLEPSAGRDLDELCRLLWHPLVRLYLCDDAALPRAAVGGMLAQSAELDGRGLGLWTVRIADAGFAGVAGLLPVPAGGGAAPEMAGGVEPLIALDPAFWGDGHATAALALLAGHARDRCGLGRLVAAVDEPDRASRRLMGRCGFEEIGRAPGPRYTLVLYRRWLTAQ